MTKTVYRSVGTVRRTPRPGNAGRISGSFDGMLVRLGLASSKLKRARKRR
ncbi:MAG: hypothetical protein H7144_18010 [Burkholderiales bacterium]|nr:hypothetical protein [Phycisphaerae bacterium]